MGPETQRGRKWPDSASRLLGRLCVSGENRPEAARLSSPGHRPGAASMAPSPALKGSPRPGRSLPCAPPSGYVRVGFRPPGDAPISPMELPRAGLSEPFGREGAFGNLDRSALVFLWHVSIWSTIKPTPDAISQRKVRGFTSSFSEESRVRTAPLATIFSERGPSRLVSRRYLGGEVRCVGATRRVRQGPEDRWSARTRSGSALSRREGTMIGNGGPKSVAMEALGPDASRPAGPSGGRPSGPTPARPGIRTKKISSILLFAAGHINMPGFYDCHVRQSSSSRFVARTPSSFIVQFIRRCSHASVRSSSRMAASAGP